MGLGKRLGRSEGPIPPPFPPFDRLRASMGRGLVA